MKALTTFKLNSILKKNPVTKKNFIGTFPGCVLPSKNTKQYSFITNTDLHHQSGEHWNAWVVKENNIIFFDSFGRDPRDTSFPNNYKNIVDEMEIYMSNYGATDFHFEDLTAIVRKDKIIVRNCTMCERNSAAL